MTDELDFAMPLPARSAPVVQSSHDIVNTGFEATFARTLLDMGLAYAGIQKFNWDLIMFTLRRAALLYASIFVSLFTFLAAIVRHFNTGERPAKMSAVIVFAFVSSWIAWIMSCWLGPILLVLYFCALVLVK